MCQNVSVRRTRDEVSSTYTYPTVGPDENETSSGAMWGMFQQRHEYCFTTEDLRKVKTNLENIFYCSHLCKNIDLVYLAFNIVVLNSAFRSLR